MHKLKILFLCTGNSCRSQMAEGWARFIIGEIIEPFSAGIEAHGINPFAVKVMAEAGVDISHQRSKLVEEVMDTKFDYVITLCNHANENCPFFPDKVRRIHRGFKDPVRLAEQAVSVEDKLKLYRQVRDEIKKFVENIPDIVTSYKRT